MAYVFVCVGVVVAFFFFLHIVATINMLIIVPLWGDLQRGEGFGGGGKKEKKKSSTVVFYWERETYATKVVKSVGLHCFVEGIPV